MAKIITKNGKVIIGGGKLYAEYEPEDLCFTAEQANSTVQLVKYNSPYDVSLFTSTDGKNWTSYTIDSIITLYNVGDKVYFKGTTTNFGKDENQFYNFRMSGRIAGSGKVASLINYTPIKAWCFNSLFYNFCSALTSAPELPADTNLPEGCYKSMFSGCSSIVTPPSMSPTSMASKCCCYMFNKCTSLTSTPDLSNVSSISTQACMSMFSGCTSLTTVSALPATTVGPMGYAWMFEDCTSLTSVPNLPTTTMDYASYMEMFEGCTSLQVSDTQTATASYAWTIPSSGVFTGSTEYDQSGMFTSCAGTRASDNLVATIGSSCTYYTQNPPIS